MEWDRLQVAMRNTPKVPKPTLVKLASNTIFEFLGMTKWGVGSIPFKVQAKVECNKDSAIAISKTQVGYAKALGMSTTRRNRLCKLCGVRRLAFLRSTMNQNCLMVSKF